MADAPPRRSRSSRSRGLDVYYGRSHALQGVDLTLDSGVLSVVGRNGMGKTTLCKTIMGLVRATGGSVRMGGEDLLSLQPAQIARLGVGYVPQGRRLWRSLTVDEHLRMTAGMRRGAWTVERIYDTFPRLAERKNNGGGQLSGGEQQMLAISRALVTNPRLLIMDEPTEGLAPVIVAQVEEMLVRLGEEGDIVGARDRAEYRGRDGGRRTASPSWSTAASIASSNSARLAADRDLQQRLLGVGRHSDAEAEVDRGGQGGRRCRTRRLRRARRAWRRSASTFPIRRRRPAGRSRCRSRASSPARGRFRPACSGFEEAARPRREHGSGAKLRTADRARRRHARHQGRGTPIHPRYRRGQRAARAPRRRLDQRQGCILRRLRAGNRAQPPARRQRRVRLGSRRLGDGDGGGVRQLAAPPGRRRRRDLAPAARAAPRWSRRACARCRSACRS